MRLRIILIVIFAFVGVYGAFAENDEKNREKSSAGYEFTDEIVLPVTSVKDQYNTGTCWSFSGLSFLESEMLRLGKPEVNLSEMFIVWHSYSEKAIKNVRVHGNLNFSPGGAFHDVTNSISKYGIIPESVYSGIKEGETRHIHGEMDRELKNEVNAVVRNREKKLNLTWHDTIKSTLNEYLGEIPENFEYKGKTYTPQSFATDFIGLNMDDYIEVTSYTHHPFYSKFILEIPDNWSWDELYNVPLNELESIIENALLTGYTVAWAADVSELGFKTSDEGFAVMPAVLQEEISDAEIARWNTLSENEKENELFALDKPVSEIEVTQEMRQIAFDNYQTTDDHGLHIVGTARNTDGTLFYKVKNSWGNYNKYGGFFYVSKPYVAYKTMSIMVHKDAVPKNIREKLDL